MAKPYSQDLRNRVVRAVWLVSPDARPPAQRVGAAVGRRNGETITLKSRMW